MVDLGTEAAWGHLGHMTRQFHAISISVFSVLFSLISSHSSRYHRAIAYMICVATAYVHFLMHRKSNVWCDFPCLSVRSCSSCRTYSHNGLGRQIIMGTIYVFAVKASTDMS